MLEIMENELVALFLSAQDSWVGEIKQPKFIAINDAYSYKLIICSLLYKMGIFGAVA